MASSELGSSGAELGSVELGSVTPDVTGFDEITSDVLNFSDYYEYEIASGQALTNILVLRDSFTYSQITLHHNTLSNNLIFSDSFQYLLNTGKISDVLNFVDSFNVNLNTLQLLTDRLIFRDTYIVQGTYSKTISDTLNFSDGSVTQQVDNNSITLPSWVVITDKINTYKKYLYLQSTSAAIMLDSPLFGDLQSNVNSVLVNRTVGGARYSYKKTSKRKHLKYEFNLRCGKYNELLVFLDVSMLDWISLTNWKDEVWAVRIVNESAVLKSPSRDLQTVTLEFEGYLVTSGNYKCLE